MADQRIVLQYDPTEAVASSARANKAIESNEKTAERAGAAIAKGLLRTMLDRKSVV